MCVPTPTGGSDEWAAIEARLDNITRQVGELATAVDALLEWNARHLELCNMKGSDVDQTEQG